MLLYTSLSNTFSLPVYFSLITLAFQIYTLVGSESSISFTSYTVHIISIHLPGFCSYWNFSKAVPLHATWGERSATPTHSWPRHYMGVSGQLHAPAALCPRERTPGTHCTGGWVGLRAGLDTEARGKILCPCRGSNPYRPVVQSVVRHYTNWATPASSYWN
jgi:hypothetical protein